MEAPHNGQAAESVAAPDAVTVRIAVESPEQMTELGRELAGLLAPGDLVMLTGELGAGKTTLTRGLGEGLGVRGAVTSPTFVIARVHPRWATAPPWSTSTPTAWAAGSTKWRTWTSTCRCRTPWWSWSGATARSRSSPTTGSTWSSTAPPATPTTNGAR